jgi:hypothetical protein
MEKIFTPAKNVLTNGKVYAEILDWVISGKASRATKYMAKNHIIRATRTRYANKFGQGNIEITLSIGKPNFAEREYIKNVLSKEKFPMQGVVVKLYNPKKTKLKRK